MAALVASGVPLAPAMVFLISSPLMSPSAFIITLGGLGPSLAAAKMASAVIIGLAAGWITNRLWALGYLGKHTLKVHEESLSSVPSAEKSKLTVQAASFKG